ncbi:ATP-binding protein [Persicitalea sp.]|uniref:sensor histidine kinase n=1 Tax=Persicitalea sp. TaxID=3100273 RepID=UPI0035932FAD
MWLWLFLGLSGFALGQSGQGVSETKDDSVALTLERQIEAARSDTALIEPLLRLSGIRLSQSRPEAALSLIRQSWQLAKESKNPLYLGRVYSGLGAYYDHQKRPGQSVRAFERAVYFLRQARVTAETTEAMYQLAMGYADQTDQARAVRYTNQCIRYARRTGNSGWIGSFYELLSILHFRIGDREGVWDDLMGLKAALRQHPCAWDEYLYHQTAAYWYGKNDRQKLFAHIKKTLAAAQRLESRIHVVETCAMIVCNYTEEDAFPQAQYYLSMGLGEVEKHAVASSFIYVSSSILREAQNRLPEAEADALKALQVAQKVGSPFSIEPVLATVARLQEKRGKYRAALATYEELGMMRDSIKQLDQAKAIAAVESELLVQQKDRDLRLMRQNSLIQEQAFEQSQLKKNFYLGLAACLTLLLFLMYRFTQRDRWNLRILSKQQAEIATQAKRLEELNQVKDRLFELIGHDLRAPVIHLKLIVDRLDQPQESAEEQNRQNDHLRRTIDTLYYTLDNLLHWASTQREGIILQPEWVSPGDLVAETLALFKPAIEDKQIDIDVAIPDDSIVRADESQLQIVIRNILHNALKFTPPGGQIRVSFRQSATEKTLCIADSGVGMATTDPQTVAQSPGTLGEKGTGLGLLVCEEFMKRNGGRIEIRSASGQGTSVCLVFPWEELASPAEVYVHEVSVR